MKINKSHFILGLFIGLFLGVAAGVLAMVLRARTLPAPIVIMPPAATATPQPTATPLPLRVFVSGAVAAPAVYELPPGSIVADAITHAGGLTAEAQQQALNLAQPLLDGMHLHVPATADTAAAPVSQESAAPRIAPASGGLININTATAGELSSLPGIGPSTAQNIIDYRQANGPFVVISDIMKVAGIGETRFNQIKELITTE